MNFGSFEFIFLFLPVVLIGFFLTAKFFGSKCAQVYLILFSLIFYAFQKYFYIALPVLIISTLTNYFTARRINLTHKIFWLVTGIIFNILALCYFKYFSPEIMPLGISFFTFTQTAYLINTFNNSAKNLGFINYFEFVTFFPYIISGPIADFREMSGQFNNLKIFVPDYENISFGLNLFVFGLFKKIVIADNLALTVEAVFSNADYLTMPEAWAGALAYTFQLYFDFSGYSNMAMGLASMFNLKIPLNFDSPYKSLSVIEFWRRWHITLSKWIRDYIYIPLGGSRVGEFKRVRNLLISMLITGIWHGTGLNFIFWGFLHGIFLIINHTWRKFNIILPKFISWLITFSSVLICWIFFRADNISDGFKILKCMFDINKFVIPETLGRYIKFIPAFRMAVRWHEFLFLFMLFIIVPFMPSPEKFLLRVKLNYKFLMLMLILALISFYFFSQVSDFLYFKF